MISANDLEVADKEIADVTAQIEAATQARAVAHRKRADATLKLDAAKRALADGGARAQAAWKDKRAELELAEAEIDAFDTQIGELKTTLRQAEKNRSAVANMLWADGRRAQAERLLIIVNELIEVRRKADELEGQAVEIFDRELAGVQLNYKACP